MILLALYALLVWVGVAWWRRRWPGAVVLVLSSVPIAAFTVFAGYIASEPGAAERFGLMGTFAGYGRVIYTVSGFYAALVLGIGLLIFVQPRRFLGHECESCGYDMRGSVTDICPECGSEHAGSDAVA